MKSPDDTAARVSPPRTAIVNACTTSPADSTQRLSSCAGGVWSSSPSTSYASGARSAYAVDFNVDGSYNLQGQAGREIELTAGAFPRTADAFVCEQTWAEIEIFMKRVPNSDQQVLIALHKIDGGTFRGTAVNGTCQHLRVGLESRGVGARADGATGPAPRAAGARRTSGRSRARRADRARSRRC